MLPPPAVEGTFAQMLAPHVLRGHTSNGDGAEICSRLAERAFERYPLTHLATRDSEDLAARDALIESAQRLAAGEWDVFGTAVRVDPATHDWTCHPFTGARTADVHWSRVTFMSGLDGGDVKHVWELSRHGQLVSIAQGYFLTREEHLAETALSLLDRWLDQNPPGRGVNWTSSLEVAFRAIAWCWLWVLTCRSRAWNDTRLRRFLHSLGHHARHVARFDSVHHSPNTHLTGEALGLLYVGLFFPELTLADEWVRLGRDILDDELEHQVLTDGMHFERATGYHRYTLEFYVHYLLLADAFGLPIAPAVRTRVRDQAAVSWLLRRPDGSWPVVGDEDGGSTLLLAPTDPQDHGSLLGVAGALFDAPSWLPTATDPRAAAAWWLLDATAWERFRSRPRPAADADGGGALRAAGYFVGREDGSSGAWYCLVDAGPHGGDRTGHAHTDLGHVEIAHGSAALVADPGCVAYTIDAAARDLARSERVHACLVIDGEPLAVPRGPFAWARLSPTPTVDWANTPSCWWCELRYERPTSLGAVSHRRSVVLVRGGGVVVSDWVLGDVELDMALHWPLGTAPEDIALSEDSARVAAHRVGWYAPEPTGRLCASLAPLVRAPGYGRSRVGRLLRIGGIGGLPSPIVTTFTDASRDVRVRFHGTDTVAVEFGDESNPVTMTMSAGRAPVCERPSKIATYAAGVVG